MSQNWPCGNCGETNYYKSWSGKGYERCDRCCDFKAVRVPDVYWDGTEEHGLPDDPRTGQPRTFSSKGEKVQFLREHNLVEAGDKIRGAPPSILREQGHQENARELTMKALHHVNQMGADRRREEYRRILRKSGRN